MLGPTEGPCPRAGADPLHGLSNFSAYSWRMNPFPAQPELPNSVDLLSPSKWPAGVVWHYTNAAGLAGILDRNVLWASSTAFMNDHHELRTGADLLRDLLERHKNHLEPKVLHDVQSMVRHALSQDRYKTFVTCACRDGNNLTMWRNYTGPEVGFAVALDTTKPLSMRRQKAMTAQTVDKLGIPDVDDEKSRQHVIADAHRSLGTFEWRQAVYESEKQIEIAWGRLRELVDAAEAHAKQQQGPRHELDVMADIYSELQAFKNSGFEDEREMRVVCWTALYSTLVYVKHRPSRYGIVPYVELCLPADPDGSSANYPEPIQELPIVGISVGPTPYPEEAATGARELLRSIGRDTIPVISSKVPFRW